MITVTLKVEARGATPQLNDESRHVDKMPVRENCCKEWINNAWSLAPHGQQWEVSECTKNWAMSQFALFEALNQRSPLYVIRFRL